MLARLFTSEEAMDRFKVRYWEELAEDKRTSSIDYFGWDSVGYDILIGLYSSYYGVGNDCMIEIGSYWTKSGNPERVLVGELVAVPELNEDTEDFEGDYQFS